MRCRFKGISTPFKTRLSHSSAFDRLLVMSCQQETRGRVCDSNPSIFFLFGIFSDSTKSTWPNPSSEGKIFSLSVINVCGTFRRSSDVRLHPISFCWSSSNLDVRLIFLPGRAVSVIWWFKMADRPTPPTPTGTDWQPVVPLDVITVSGITPEIYAKLDSIGCSWRRYGPLYQYSQITYQSHHFF